MRTTVPKVNDRNVAIPHELCRLAVYLTIAGGITPNRAARWGSEPRLGVGWSRWHGVAPDNMAIYNRKMAISISKFRNSCLDVIRRVEATGQSVSITRRGKVVARLSPSFQATQSVDAKPWEKLRALEGELLAGPGESVVREEEFEALR